MNIQFISNKMKRFIYILFILSMLSYLLGIITLFQNNYDFANFADKFKPLNLCNLKFYMEENKFNYSFYNSDVFTEYDLNDDINSIYINLSSQNIQLNAYDGDKLQIKATSKDFITNNDLLISQSQYRFDISLKNPTKEADVSIFIPRALLKRYSLFIDTNDGNILIHNSCIDSINCSTYDGSIYISNMEMNYLTLKNNNGDINIRNSFTHFDSKINLSSGDFIGIGDFGLLNLDNKCGNVYLNTYSISHDMTINCTSGDISLLFPKESDYKVRYNLLSGFLVNSDAYLTSGNEKNIVDVTTTSGNLFVGQN